MRELSLAPARRVPVGIGHVRDALAPRHVGRLPQHRRAAGAQLLDEAVDLVDVDEEPKRTPLPTEIARA
jgi:hypothetical protein